MGRSWRRRRVQRWRASMKINAWNFPILFLEKLKPQTNHLKERYEKTININRYRQYRCGPGINIRLPEYRHRRGCSKPAGSSRWSTRPTADTGTVSLPYTRDRRTLQHRSSAVWWVWADGHRGPGGLVKASATGWK